MRNDTQAFTLIELLIVLVIIGIVTTLALPQFKTWIRQTQAAEAKQILNAASNAVWHHYVEAGSFPASIDNAGYSFPPSKYFVYAYTQEYIQGGHRVRGVVSAIFKDSGTVTDGRIVMYCIAFLDGPPWSASQTNCSQMDDRYYKLYWVKTKDMVMALEFLLSWDFDRRYL